MGMNFLCGADFGWFGDGLFFLCVQKSNKGFCLLGFEFLVVQNLGFGNGVPELKNRMFSAFQEDLRSSN